MNWKTCVIAAALCIGSIGGPPAAVAQSVTTAPAARTIRVGTMTVSVLHDGRLAIPNDGSVFGANASPEEVAAVLRRAGQASTRIFLDIDVLLVRSEGRLTLIDAGYGSKGRSVLKNSLGLVHVSPLEITDVLITHAHPDHVGGLIDSAGKSVFSRATIHLSAREWRFMQRQPETRDIAAAVRAQVRTFVPGKMIVPGIGSKSLYGHTPGHVMYEIVSGADRLLDIGDAAHSSVVSLARPDWAIAWDSDKIGGAKARIRELENLSASHERMFAVHFPFPGIGHIIRRGRGFRFVAGSRPR